MPEFGLLLVWQRLGHDPDSGLSETPEGDGLGKV